MRCRDVAKSVAVTICLPPLILTAESPARERFGTLSALLLLERVKAAGLGRRLCDPTLKTPSALLWGRLSCATRRNNERKRGVPASKRASTGQHRGHLYIYVLVQYAPPLTSVGRGPPSAGSGMYCTK
jgi:hypothetical protein